jgi:hypothetical protein
MVVIPYAAAAAAAAASMQNRHIRKDGLNSYNGRPKEATVQQYISR